MTEYRIRLSIEETVRIEHEAARVGLRPELVVAQLASRAAMRLPAPRHLAPRETQTEKRARLRAADPEGKSPFTRAMEAITTRKDPYP